MTGGPAKEHGTNKPPPTRRVQERSKGDVSPWTIQFQVLDKSPVSGPGRVPLPATLPHLLLIMFSVFHDTLKSGALLTLVKTFL